MFFFFWKSNRTRFFFGNGLIETKNWWKAPDRIVDIPYKTQKRHFSTETVIFGQKKAPAASRGKWSFSWRNAIWAKKKAPAASRQPKNVQNAHFFCRKNGKKHQNRHEMVIHGSKSDVDPTKMIRKTRSTKPRSSYCAKTLKMRV